MYETEIKIGNKTYTIETDNIPTDEQIELILRQAGLYAPEKISTFQAFKEEVKKPIQKISSTITQKIAELPVEKIQERSAVFAESFAPILTLFLKPEERKYLQQLEKQHPVSRIVGEITGGIAELTAISPLTRPITRILPKTLSYSPRLYRFLASGLRSGTTLAGQNLFRESIKQLQQGKFDVKEVGKEAGLGMLFGLGLGTGEQIINIPLRTAVSSVYAGVFTSLEDYIKQKKIDPKDVLINMAIVGGFTALTGKQVSKQIEQEVYNNFYNSIKTRILEKNPKINPDIVDKITRNFVNAYFNEVYKRGGRFPTLTEIEDFVEWFNKSLWKIYIEQPTKIPSPVDKTIVREVGKAIIPIKDVKGEIVPVRPEEVVKVKPAPPKPPIPIEGKVLPQEPIKVKGEVKPKITEPEITPSQQEDIKLFTRELIERHNIPPDEAEKNAREYILLPEEKWSEETKKIAKIRDRMIIEEINKMGKKQYKIPVREEEEVEYFKAGKKYTSPPEKPPEQSSTPPPPPQGRGITDSRIAVLFASEFIKKYPQVSTRLKTSLGIYVPKEQRISVSSDIFSNQPEVVKVLLHEAGHAVDRMLGAKRNTLLGKLNRIKDYLKKEFEGVKEEEVKEEVIKVSKEFFVESRYEVLEKQKFPAGELYADLFASILHNPARVAEIAPKASKMFWNGINKNDELAKLIRSFIDLNSTEIDELVNEVAKKGASEWIKNEDLIHLARNKVLGEQIDLNEWFKNTVLKNKEEAEKIEKQLKKELGGMGRVLQEELIDKFTLLQKKAKKLYQAGVITKDDYNAILNILTQYHFTPYVLSKYKLQELFNEISDLIQKNNIKIEDINLVLLEKRILNQEDIANPLGIRPEHIPSMLETFKKQVGEEYYNKLNEVVDKVKRWHDKILIEAKQLGLNIENLEEYLKEEHFYAPFIVEKHIEERVSPFFKKRAGTLDTVKEPFYNLIEKTVVLREYAERNAYKRKLFDTVIKTFPGVEKIPGSPKNPVKLPEGYEIFSFQRDGVWERYKVPKEILKEFETGQYDLGTAKILDKTNNFIKAYFTRWNLGFICTTNFLRDLTAAILFRGRVHIWDLLKQYPEAKRLISEYLRGKTSPEIEELVKRGIIDESFFGSLTDREAFRKFLSEQDKKLLELISDEKTKNKLIGAIENVIDKIEDLGVIGEKMHKISYWKALKKNQKKLGLSDEEIGWLTKNLGGSPNFYQVAKGKHTIELPFLFYNATKQGMRRLYLGATTPGIRGTFWTGVLTITGLAMLKILAEKGFFGKDLEEKYEEASNYLKAYFPVSFPVGETRDGSLIWLRLPVAEEAVLFHALVYNVAKLEIEQTEQQVDLKELYQAYKSTIGRQLPGINPAVELGFEIIRTLTGDIPLEYYMASKKGKDRLVGAIVGDKFNLNAFEKIWEDIEEGRELKITIPARSPLVNRVLRVIPFEERLKNFRGE